MDAANVEIPKQERFLPTLGTIAHVAPLLGLLGTVTGNIGAFGVLGEAGGLADSSQLALGISEALLTTAAGMIVGIPTIMFYNYLVTKANNTIVRLEKPRQRTGAAVRSPGGLMVLRRRRLQRSTTVDMVPMIDVVFQLVIFFMVSSTFKITPAIGLTLPDSATAVPTEMTRLIVGRAFV